jgi:EAL domain-containing protein (putative c-di-GMP-specific phosphodiesterase class I)/GGDEF domain-containing protein/PAS domain-containing protein
MAATVGRTAGADTRQSLSFLDRVEMPFLARPSLSFSTRVGVGKRADFMNEPTVVVLLVTEDKALLKHVCEVGLSRAALPYVRIDPCTALEAAVEDVARDGHDGYLVDELLVDDFAERVSDAAGLPPLIVLRRATENGATSTLPLGTLATLDADRLTPARLVNAVRCAAEHSATKFELRASEERFALLLAASRDVIWEWQTEPPRVTLHGAQDLLGYGPTLISTTEAAAALVHPEDLPRVRGAVDEVLRAGRGRLELDLRVCHRDGSWRRALVRGAAKVDASGGGARFAGFLLDGEERVAEEVAELGEDPDLLLDRVRSAITLARRSPERRFTLLCAAMDRLDQFAATMGHAIAHRLLLLVAARIREQLQPGETLARLTGDQLAVLAETPGGAAEPRLLAERLQRCLAAPFHVNGNEVYASLCIGVAIGDGSCGAAERLLRDARTALAWARSRGLHRVEVYDIGQRERAERALRLEADLRRAVDAEEFRIQVQPIVFLESGRVAGWEALARWHHPQRGIVSPGEFIPVAEETGMVVPIGWQVLQRACEWAARSGRRGRRGMQLPVNVNLSPRQVCEPDLLARVSDVLERTGLEPRRLKLEITETSLMENADRAVDVLAGLRSLGIGVCLDDFGTGYSSLNYLHRYPLEDLKIDRAFVAEMSGNQRDVAILQTIVTLGHGLGMDVVAEGIETPLQLGTLRGIGCDHGQGFLFSRPIDPDDADRVDLMTSLAPP